MVYELDGAPILFPENGAMVNTDPFVVAGNFKKAVYAFRKEITFKIFTEGVVTDNEGNVIYNLMQQDMVALRAVMRIAWALPNPVNAVNENESSRYPFAVLCKGYNKEIKKITFSVKAPVNGATPDSSVDAGENATATIKWDPAESTFAKEKSYKATVKYVANDGFEFDSALEDGVGFEGLPTTGAKGVADKLTIERVSPKELNVVVNYKALK